MYFGKRCTDLWDVVVDAAGLMVGRKRVGPAQTGAVTAHCTYRTMSQTLKSPLTDGRDARWK